MPSPAGSFLVDSYGNFIWKDGGIKLSTGTSDDCCGGCGCTCTMWGLQGIKTTGNVVNFPAFTATFDVVTYDLLNNAYSVNTNANQTFTVPACQLAQNNVDWSCNLLNGRSYLGNIPWSQWQNAVAFSGPRLIASNPKSDMLLWNGSTFTPIASAMPSWTNLYPGNSDLININDNSEFFRYVSGSSWTRTEGIYVRGVNGGQTPSKIYSGNQVNVNAHPGCAMMWTNITTNSYTYTPAFVIQLREQQYSEIDINNTYKSATGMNIAIPYTWGSGNIAAGTYTQWFAWYDDSESSPWMLSFANEIPSNNVLLEYCRSMNVQSIPLTRVRINLSNPITFSLNSANSSCPQYATACTSDKKCWYRFEATYDETGTAPYSWVVSDVLEKKCLADWEDSIIKNQWYFKQILPGIYTMQIWVSDDEVCTTSGGCVDPSWKPKPPDVSALDNQNLCYYQWKATAPLTTPNNIQNVTVALTGSWCINYAFLKDNIMIFGGGISNSDKWEGPYYYCDRMEWIKQFIGTRLNTGCSDGASCEDDAGDLPAPPTREIVPDDITVSIPALSYSFCQNSNFPPAGWGNGYITVNYPAQNVHLSKNSNYTNETWEGTVTGSQTTAHPAGCDGQPFPSDAPATITGTVVIELDATAANGFHITFSDGNQPGPMPTSNAPANPKWEYYHCGPLIGVWNDDISVVEGYTDE